VEEIYKMEKKTEKAEDEEEKIPVSGKRDCTKDEKVVEAKEQDEANAETTKNVKGSSKDEEYEGEMEDAA
jgi:hypothetical protein